MTQQINMCRPKPNRLLLAGLITSGYEKQVGFNHGILSSHPLALCFTRCSIVMFLILGLWCVIL